MVVEELFDPCPNPVDPLAIGAPHQIDAGCEYTRNIGDLNTHLPDNDGALSGCRYSDSEPSPHARLPGCRRELPDRPRRPNDGNSYQPVVRRQYGPKQLTLTVVT